MTLIQAQEFFYSEKILSNQLMWLNKIGLGYITLRQTLDTLSGGELQRLKLALNLDHQNKIFILDEPTSGLSQSDIQILLKKLIG